MMYAVYDESGRITQANQVYGADPKLEPMMRDLGQTFVKDNRSLVSPDHWYVSLKPRHCGPPRARLRERSTMPITQSATTIRAGGKESVVFRNIRKGARCTISSGGYGLYDLTMEDEELEISIPVPCIYQVKFTLWPHREQTFKVEAVAS